jgi:hypothetical protein
MRVPNPASPGPARTIPKGHDVNVPMNRYCDGLNALPRDLRFEAGDVLIKIGNGMRLMVCADSSVMLVEGLRLYGENREPVSVRKEVAAALVESGLLHRMTAQESMIEPPEGAAVYCLVI